MAQKNLNSMGINTIGQLADTPEDILQSKFGQLGKIMHQLANGIDNRPGGSQPGTQIHRQGNHLQPGCG
ncbi:MAG: hypothetical protein U5N58_00625 [Actinomycetota bacterium]|nr:hypothetical protein [Actinomycetota bacterium]